MFLFLQRYIVSGLTSGAVKEWPCLPDPTRKDRVGTRSTSPTTVLRPEPGADVVSCARR